MLNHVYFFKKKLNNIFNIIRNWLIYKIMNIQEFEKIIIQVIKKILSRSENSSEINKNMPLIGSGSPLDSMKLVELCIELEDFAEEKGFDFDWTSEKAMSKSLKASVDPKT